jgi:hypothetical protein
VESINVFFPQNFDHVYAGNRYWGLTACFISPSGIYRLGRAVANPHIRDKSMPTDRGNVKVFS